MRRIKNVTLKSISAFFIFLWLSLKSTAAPLLNGMAIYTELNEEQFMAALYSETLSFSARDLLIPNENKRMEIRILTDKLLPHRFKRLWIEGIAVNSSQSELRQQANNTAYFSNLLKIKLRAGDILSIEQSTLEGTKVFLNSSLLGTIEDGDFFNLLLRTWIGPVPLSPEFRINLLNEGNINSKELARLESIVPSTERIREIKDIVASKNTPESKEDKDQITNAAASLLSRQLYLISLRHWSNKFLKYPKQSIDQGHEGNVRLDVYLDRTGNVIKIETIKAAERDRLTKAAIRGVYRANPFPPVPEKVKGLEFVFSLPVMFVIEDE